MSNTNNLSQSFYNFTWNLVTFSWIVGYFYSSYRFLVFLNNGFDVFSIALTLTTFGLVWGITGLLFSKLLNPQKPIENAILSFAFFTIAFFIIFQHTLATILVTSTLMTVVLLFYWLKHGDNKIRQQRIIERRAYIQQRQSQITTNPQSYP